MPITRRQLNSFSRLRYSLERLSFVIITSFPTLQLVFNTCFLNCLFNSLRRESATENYKIQSIGGRQKTLFLFRVSCISLRVTGRHPVGSLGHFLKFPVSFTVLNQIN